MRGILWVGVIPLLACGLLALAFAADLGAAAVVYGPEYVWRLIAWRAPSPHDDARFPARRIAPSAHPVHFRVDSDGAAPVRAAFTLIAPAEAQPGETFEHFLARTQTTSLLVLRDGHLLYEGYFNGHQRDTVQGSFSMAKSVTSLLIGAAIAESKLPSIDTPAQDLLPDVKWLRGSGISLRNLLDMTSGFAMDNARPFWPFSIPWSDRKLMYFAPDLRAVATAARPEYRPGTHFLYDDRNPMLLGMMLEGATHEHVAGWPYEDNMFYGLLWWGFTRANGPQDVFADGRFGQVILVSRANGIVVLRTGNGEGGVASWPRLLRARANALGPAAR